jgi:uncharacterized protein (UPF0248 family)
MLMRESDKHFLWAMFGATGIIMFWRGIWEGVGSLPILENVWVSLFVGLSILTFSGLIFREFDPLGGLEDSALKIMNSVHNHPEKHTFTIKYYDNMLKKEIEISAKNIKQIEKNIIAIHEGTKELFIPIHRIRSVHKLGKCMWKS